MNCSPSAAAQKSGSTRYRSRSTTLCQEQKTRQKHKSQYEIDFVVNTGHERIYIQSALNVDTDAKRNQETFSLKNSGDFFRKVVILDGNAKSWMDDDGIMYVGIIPFLLEEVPL